MVRPLGLSSEDSDAISGVRSIAVDGSSGKIVADPVSLVDSNYPVVNAGILNCRSWRSIWVGAEQDDGSPLPNMTSLVIEPIILDARAADNQHWKRLKVGGTAVNVTIADGFEEVLVAGRTIFLRLASVSGNITQGIKLLAFPGQAALQ